MAALLRPGTRDATVRLLPAAGIPDPRDICAGGQAIVVSYAEGLGNIAPAGPPPGSSAVYDTVTGSWLRGPTAGGSRVIFGTYWTPYGVVSLGSPASWLLRPSAPAAMSSTQAHNRVL